MSKLLDQAKTPAAASPAAADDCWQAGAHEGGGAEWACSAGAGEQHAGGGAAGNAGLRGERGGEVHPCIVNADDARQLSQRGEADAAPADGRNSGHDGDRIWLLGHATLRSNSGAGSSRVPGKADHGMPAGGCGVDGWKGTPSAMLPFQEGGAMLASPAVRAAMSMGKLQHKLEQGPGKKGQGGPSNNNK
eukprot:jgi/Mesvir1/24530/Mv25997-RA.1